MPARDWLKALAQYREPNEIRSVLELLLTALLFVGTWVAAWWALSVSYWLTLLICIPAAGLLVRLFAIQHDCGHYSFFRRRGVNDWVGRALGVITLTPYDVWRRSHAIHHASCGNLGKRGIGDIDTLTVREYEALPPLRRIAYRLYRNPLVMFGLGPAYIFFLENRLPFGYFRAGSAFWISAMGTNVAIAATVGLMMYTLGVLPVLMIQIPVTLLAASIGVWLFYVQHQFEDTVWAEDEKWQLHDAALYGSSHYDLPGILCWFTANIGIHHVHHLSSRIPFYRLPQVLRDFPELAQVRRLTLMTSFACLNLKLWDETSQTLVSFPKAGQQTG